MYIFLPSIYEARPENKYSFAIKKSRQLEKQLFYYH